jgi:hypothetical protein
MSIPPVSRVEQSRKARWQVGHTAALTEDSDTIVTAMKIVATAPFSNVGKIWAIR